MKKYEKKKKVVVKIEKTDAGDEKKAEASDEESIWSNPKDQLANKAMDKAIDGLLNLTTNLDVGTSKPKREIKLAGSQKFPFVGNSTMKRIIKGIQVSPNHYDPFDVVDEFLHEKLMEFVNVDDEEARLAKTRQFYLQIITPRDDWISGDYGWLATGHMYVAMTMFRNRHMSQPSPYCSQRIAFLDPFFITHIQCDYPVYLAQGKNFVFRKTYRDNVFGLQPLVTNKRWFIDIDHLYGCLFVGTNHWVAIDVDFVKKTIFIYDSIPPEDDEKLQESVRPIRKMIPAILSEYIPAMERKKSCAMMDVKRMLTNVPVNENPGDCGVYTLKYIECLALGLKFDGLSDKIIQNLRVKLASDIYAEAHYEVSDGLFDEYCLRKDVVPELIDEDVSEDELEEL